MNLLDVKKTSSIACPGCKAGVKMFECPSDNTNCIIGGSPAYQREEAIAKW